MTSKGRSSLQSSLDKEVFQVVRKYQDDQSNELSSLPSVAVIYRYIQSSNSTLKRKPKQLLNGSIERVLAVLAEAKEESDESQENIDIDVDMDDLNGNVMPSRSANFMNKSITGAWATGSSGTATPLPPIGTNGRHRL
jgi:ribosome biogenesis ATPase